MSLTPLLETGPLVQIHAFAALAALALGILQFAGPKGNRPHRVIGWMWVLLMAVVALSSFGINDIRTLGPFSAIHLLSVFVLVVLPLAVWRARRHEIERHRKAMVALYIGALILAGALTLLPGRVMHEVVYGTSMR